MSDWSYAEFEDAARETVRVLRDYIERSRRGEGPVVRLTPMEEIFGEEDLAQRIEDGGMGLDGLADFLEDYLNHSTRVHHPGYLAHQVAVPDSPAALADLVHGVVHNPMAIYEMGPSAAVLEMAVLKWMLSKVGWEKHGGGVLTHGGSLANLTALVAARAAADPEAWERGVRSGLVVLAPPGAHYSVRRAVSIAGLGGASVRNVPVRRNEVADPEALRRTLQGLTDQGTKVMAVVANACATGTGLHDPLDELGQVCRENDIWLHVDGAHGASALISKKERRQLQGIELANSMTWDAHKMLRTSGLCTAVLFRESQFLDRAFSQEASYLFYGEDKQGVDLIHRTVECTKAALGTKVFMNLAWRGEKGIAKYIEEQYALTREIHRVVESRDGFECPYAPESNILCFRYRGDDALQVAIRERLLAEGRFYITSTEIDEQRYLRLTVISPQTTLDTIEQLLDAVERIANSVR